MKEYIKRIKFAWNAIRYGIPPEFEPQPAHHYITEHRMDIETFEGYSERPVSHNIPDWVHEQTVKKILLDLLEDKEYIKFDKEITFRDEEYMLYRGTLKVAVER